MNNAKRFAWLAAGMMLLACDLRPPATAASEKRAPAASPAGKRRALLIGINDYSASTLGTPPPNAPNRGWRNLDGAVNDVESMREMLEHAYGFRASDIVVLKNQAATRRAILGAIDSHLERPTKTGDVVLFYYSGHGSQVPNPASSEDDGHDETIVPADSRLGVSDIRDKDLRRKFNEILDRGAKLTVILDSCHSGSGTRDGLESELRARSVRPDPRPISDPAEPPLPEDRGAVVLSASQDFESAREMRDRGVPRGVFSWAWLEAMRHAAPGERVTDTFLRAQALVRAESAAQDPVLAGTPDARATPFLDTVRAAAGMTMAIEKVQRDGTVIVQGGWAHGLTVGSEMRLVRDGNDARLEVTEMLGLGRCIARVHAPRGVPKALKSGTLVHVSGWVAPPARPLRVWMPRAASIEPLVEWTERLARAAAEKGVPWINDPAEATATHVIRWRGDRWELLAEGVGQFLSADVDARDVLAQLPVRSSLFVQLPAPEWLIQGIAVGPGTGFGAVEPVASPEAADYTLTGRWTPRGVEYAWVRASLPKNEQRRTALPSRTAWQAVSIGAPVPSLLQHAVLGLRRIQAWQLLESPPHARSAYELELQSRRDAAPVRDRKLIGEERYTLALRARPGMMRSQRYVYVFLVDSNGKSLLLFPTATHGSVENRFPLDVRRTADVIPLGTMVRATEPYGIDSYFLLTTDEPLPDPTILEWDGLRGRPASSNALEELIAQTSSAARGGEVLRVPVNWSIDRLLFECVPPRTKGRS